MRSDPEVKLGRVIRALTENSRVSPGNTRAPEMLLLMDRLLEVLIETVVGELDEFLRTNCRVKVMGADE